MTEREGELIPCEHCDRTGKQDGPGGWEECCHCHGKGEVWMDDVDLPGDDE
jgi:DnaJ-class molecular chaperone